MEGQVMADEADIAQQYEEREREAALARRKRYVSRDTCAECGEKLEPHRIYFGTCVECAEVIERQGKQYGGR